MWRLEKNSKLFVVVWSLKKKFLHLEKKPRDGSPDLMIASYDLVYLDYRRIGRNLQAGEKEVV